jgi:hypothetical protein
MLSMLSWSNEKLKMRRKGRKLTPSDKPKELSMYSVGVLCTLRRRPNSTGTIGWTDSPYSTCVWWMEEMKQQRTVALDELSVWVRTPLVYLMLHLNQDKDAPDLRFSTRWTDGGAAVHPKVSKMRIVRFWWGLLQHQMIKRCVGS